MKLKSKESQITLNSSFTSSKRNKLESLDQLPMAYAINFKESSFANIDFAYDLTKKLGIDLKIINVLESDLILDNHKEVTKEATSIELYKKKVAQYLKPFPGLSLEVYYGNVSRTLISLSKELGMLFYTKGQVGGIGDVLFNKDTNKILWDVECPVCILPSKKVSSSLTECTSFSIGTETENIKKIILNFANTFSLKYKHINVLNKVHSHINSNESLLLNEMIIVEALTKLCENSEFSLCSIVGKNTGEAIMNYLKQHSTTCIIALLNKNEIKDSLARQRFQEMLSFCKVPVILIKENIK